MLFNRGFVTWSKQHLMGQIRRPILPALVLKPIRTQIHPLLPDYGASHNYSKSSYDALPCNSKWIGWFIIFQVEDVVVTVPFPKQVLNVNLTPSGEVSISYVIQLFSYK